MAGNGVGHKQAEVGRIPTQVGRKKIQLISGSWYHLYNDIFLSFQLRIRGAGWWEKSVGNKTSKVGNKSIEVGNKPIKVENKRDPTQNSVGTTQTQDLNGCFSQAKSEKPTK